MLNYYVKEENKNFRINLSSNVSNYSIKNLQPGSTLIVSILSLKNKTEITISNELICYTGIYLFLIKLS
jgi:hypothetical protein